MFKIGCNSQDKIIDFIEKSNHYIALKKRYTDLSAIYLFKSELQKISTQTFLQSLKCTFICNNEEKELIPFIQRLLDDLALAGITASIERGETNKILNEKNNLRSNECIIHFLTLKTNEPFQTHHSTNAIFTYYCINNTSENKDKLAHIEYIDLTDSTNYHLLFFDVLAKLTPEINYDDLIKFKKEPLKSGKEQVKSDHYKKGTILKSPWWLPIKRFQIIFLLVILSCGYFIYQGKEKSKGVQLSKQNTVIGSTLGSYQQHERGKQIQWNLPPQHHQFIVRAKLLEKMRENLQSQSPNSKNSDIRPTILVCNGLGGVGKTQLALQYVYHTKFYYGLKAWFIADNLDQLRRQYIEFAKHLGYKENNPSFNNASHYLKSFFLNHPDWLIVFDNVEAYESILEFLPEGRGNIIITTRHQDWPNAFRILNVNVMTETESIDLLASSIQHDLDNKESNSAKELVNTLGYLPLALTQAGAYMKQNSITVSKYLDLYKKHTEELLMDTTLPKGTNSLPVEVTWKMSLDTISKQDKENPGLALHLLAACAYMAPEKISRNLLLAWLKEAEPNLLSPELALPKLIGKLWRYSLVSKGSDGNITIHRLVQTVIRHQHRSPSKQSPQYFPELTQDWYSKLLKSIHKEFNRQSTPLVDETRQRDLLPHLQALLHYYEQMRFDDHQPYLADVMNDLGKVFFLLDPKLAKFYHE